MNYEPIDRTNEPATDEFEKLEFLPEEPARSAPETSDTSEITFTPESETTGEPPVSFSPAAGSEALPEDPPEALATSAFDIDAGTPFELFGTSLVDESEFEGDVDSLDADYLDDLEF